MNKKQSPTDFLNDKIAEEERLQRAKDLGFDTDTVWYHVTHADFDKFDLDKSMDGCIWLTKDYDSIMNGETGASIDSRDTKIHKFYIKANKIGGWDEEDQYFTEQLIKKDYDGVLLDNDLKMFNPNNIRKIDDKFEDKITKDNISKEFNSTTVFYHGNQNKTHRFSEIMPSFFTSDPEYAKGYGDYVYPYIIETKKPFDTATDEEARNFYNEVFLKDELGKYAKKIEKGQHIHFNDADNFWGFIAHEAEVKKSTDYDSIIVAEFKNKMKEYTTNLSIVPLDRKQIKPIEKIKKMNKPKI